MSEKNELDDILESLKERKNQIERDIEPILPPKTYSKDNDDLLWIDNSDIEQKLLAKDSKVDTLEPPMVYRDDKAEKIELEEDIKKEDKKEQEKAEDKKAKHDNKSDPKKSKRDKKLKKEKKQKKDKESFVLTMPKLLAIVITVMVVISVVVCSVIYCYHNNLYIFENYVKSYSYEHDIKDKHQLAYESDNSYCGQITIDGVNADMMMYSKNNQKGPYLYKGNDISVKQHIRSIDVSSYGEALENTYSSSEAYVNSAQKVTLDTLFETNTYKVIGAYYTNKDPADNSGYVFPYSINGTLTKQSFADYRDRVKQRLLYNTGYDFTYDDEILNLCVNSDTLMPNYKFVVVCVKMDSINKTEVVAESQQAIYYPQSYYDANNLTNPYKYAMGLYWNPTLTLDKNENNTKKLEYEDYME